MGQEAGLETGIAVDAQGIDHAIRTLNDSLHSTHKLATVAKISNSSDGERARVGRNEEVPEGVEPPVLLERFHFVWCRAPFCDEAFSFFEVALIDLFLIRDSRLQHAIRGW